MGSRQDKSAQILDHGGSLERAQALFRQAALPWIDLSTGINPHPYPLSDLPATAFTRLPEPGCMRTLEAIAAETYGAPSRAHVTAAPGTQILLPRVAALREPGVAAILGPTYAEHRRAAALAGHEVIETTAFSALADADLAIIVNPNNPDGRLVARGDLLALADRLAARGGLLVVDEAFMDVGPAEATLVGDVGHGGLVVLRSFGKFFGLAGVRLGFALSSTDVTQRLQAELGPWAVAGPALELGMRALADKPWQENMRARLASEARRLDALLSEHGVEVTGGTDLFRFVRLDREVKLFETLGRCGILVRDFLERPGVLRFGLPADEIQWQRLTRALAEWRNQAMGKVG